MLGRRKRAGREAETLTRIDFATDVHGSENCFGTFLDGALITFDGPEIKAFQLVRG